jgi:hypothetical protein
MPKAWDIVGARRQTKKPTPAASKKRAQNNCAFWLFVILVFLASMFFFGKVSESNLLVTPTKTITPESQVSSKTSKLLLEIINGSGRFEETDKVNKLVSAAGFPVAKTETSINSYDKMIIYYKSGLESQANQIATTLSIYKPQIQPFSGQSSYDLAIIIGSR